MARLGSRRPPRAVPVENTSMALVPVNRTLQVAHDALGVNIHQVSAVQDRDEAIDEIGQLGVKLARDALLATYWPPSLDIVCDRLRMLKNTYDCGLQLLVGYPWTQGGQTSDVTVALDMLKDPTRYQGLARRYEAPNEYVYATQATGATAWDQMAIHLRTWYPTLKNDPDVGGIPYDGPAWVADWDKQHWASEIADHNDICDTMNLHHYFDHGFMVEDTAHGIPHRLRPDMDLGWYQMPTPRWVVTEMGYHCALNFLHAYQPGRTERAQAYYILRCWLECLYQGAEVAIWYQMYDLWPNPELDNSEWHYGLIAPEGDENATDYTTFTYRKKPSYYAAQNLLTLLEDTTTGLPGTGLRYEVLYTTEYVRHFLLAKNDGSYIIILWRPAPVQEYVYVDADAANAQDLFPADVDVELVFSNVRTIQTARPLNSTTYTSPSPAAQTHTVAVGADPLFVHVAA